MATTTSTSFGDLIKHWRKQRGFSQLSLSLASGVSQRHISFLESGRSQPSREMILQLAEILEIPLREQNKMLTVAGFVPVFTESELSAPELAPIHQALEFTLKQQEPYPALVMDRYWNQLESNQATQRLLNGLVQPEQLLPCVMPSGQLNLMKVMLHPQGLRSVVANWEDIVPDLVQRVHRESLTKGQNETSQVLLQELLSYPDVEDLWQSKISENWQVPLLMVNFVKDSLELQFFSTITTLGTPYDITLQELRIECFFPGDEITAKRMQQFAVGE
ncbi:MAG: helix-turn-helix transcriptional regulator [Leptolyngbya sp. SIO1D8]|nr:helix-turn-helix transcriptional regulator [Leptolyngbya sp. SIO1D8]